MYFTIAKLIKKLDFRRGVRLAIAVKTFSKTDKRWEEVTPVNCDLGYINITLFTIGWNCVDVYIKEKEILEELRCYDEEDRTIAEEDIEALREAAGLRE